MYCRFELQVATYPERAANERPPPPPIVSYSALELAAQGLKRTYAVAGKKLIIMVLSSITEHRISLDLNDEPGFNIQPSQNSDLCNDCNSWQQLKGQGITNQQLKNLLKKCSGCKIIMRTHKFAAHVKKCRKVDVIDLTTDSDDDSEEESKGAQVVDILTDTE